MDESLRAKYEKTFDEYAKETDRAAALLVASAMDEQLKALLRTRLVQIYGKDNLLDGPQAPIATLSSRIDCAYRLGLISDNLRDDLHTIRTIRNEFANDVFTCTFESQFVRDEMASLRGSVGSVADEMHVTTIQGARLNKEWAKRMKGSTGRQYFLACASLIFIALDMAMEVTEPINEAEEEFFYHLDPVAPQ